MDIENVQRLISEVMNLAADEREFFMFGIELLEKREGTPKRIGRPPGSKNKPKDDLPKFITLNEGA